MAATATKESWKPGSSSAYGFHASRTAAPTSAKYQRSRGLAASHASVASPPATPALTTDGCQPTAATYPSTAASAATCASQRGTPASHAASRIPATTYATFCPETASR